MLHKETQAWALFFEAYSTLSAVAPFQPKPSKPAKSPEMA
jgi:hypothetical protein